MPALSWLRWMDSPVMMIDALSLHDEAYVDRHGNHTLNVMMICGPDYIFYSINANWPGSVHDSRVLRNSAIIQRFDNDYFQTLLFWFIVVTD